MKPLAVHLWLGSPVAYPYRRRAYPLHLDALVVALLAARDGRVRGQEYDPEKDVYAPERWPGNGVPLAVAGARRKVYRASALELPADSWCWQYGWVKKLPDVALARWTDYGRRRGDVWAPKKGEFRPWRDHLCCAVAPAARFFCVGDRGALEELLRPLAGAGGIGVRRSAGLGEVLGVEVKEAPADWSLVAAGGQPARALPVEDWPDGESRGWLREWWAFRPPYWAVANRGWCWVPPVERYYPVRGLEFPPPGNEPSGRRARNLRSRARGPEGRPVA